MAMASENTEPRYAVVVNEEEQYSIWRVGRAVPTGWREVGVTGSEQECLTHIEKVWVDMRPKSLREWMDSAARES